MISILQHIIQADRALKARNLRQTLLWRIIGILILVVCFGHPVANASSTQLREYEIKAAFLYNFAKFVEWPEKALGEDDESLVLVILGKDDFGLALYSITGKEVGNRKFVVKWCSKVEEMKLFDQCHMIFISSSEKEHFPRILEALKDTHVLIIGDTEGFAEMGGIINFTIVEKKVRFEINIDAAERAGLRISSKLLKLAKIVSEKRDVKGD